MTAKKIGILFILLDLLLINCVVGFLIYNFLQQSPDKKEITFNYTEAANPTLVSTDGLCDTSCKEELLSEIASLKESIANIKPVPTLVVAKEPIATSKPKAKNVSYVPIPGTGSTLNTSWTNLSGTDFYVNKSDYSGLTGVYFEANIKLFNGNGVAYLRIFDVTHGVGVDGSDISTSSQASVFISSSKMSLWDGNNHYIVQARSLTSDTTVFESGRLKIVTEN